VRHLKTYLQRKTRNFLTRLRTLHNADRVTHADARTTLTGGATAAFTTVRTTGIAGECDRSS